MNAAKQAAWMFSVLILLAYSGWYFASQSEVSYKLDDKMLSSTADTVIYDLSVRQFGEEGQLLNHMMTPRLDHIPLNDTHLLQQPDIFIYQDNQPPWRIRAQQAVSLDGGENITFIKNVIIHQKEGKKNTESTLRTEKITYYPTIKKATTPLLVTFEQPGSFVESVGMNMFLNDKRVELLHQARGHYAPSRG